jgi:hypothetical protein
MIEDITEVWDEFKKDIMPKVREAVREHAASYPDNFIKGPRRVQYLKGRMEKIIFKTLYLMEDYDRHVRTVDVDNRVFVGEQILGAIKTALTLQREIISLSRPEKPARSPTTCPASPGIPFADLYEFNVTKPCVPSMRTKILRCISSPTITCTAFPVRRMGHDSFCSRAGRPELSRAVKTTSIRGSRS